jgi:hypothetical protein
MEHFSTINWVDFVRKVTDEATTKAIQQHLDKGCASCLKKNRIWRLVMDETQQLSGAEPPESAVRAAKAVFRLRKVLPFPSGRLDLAALQFDSNREPAAVGVRGAHASARQLLYRSGSVCIDMRMQPTPGSESMVLIGQLLDSMNPGHGIGGIPVSLLSHGDMVSRKQTNQDGEFDFGLESEGEGNVQLVFGMADSRTIVVAVPDSDTRVM